MSNSARMGVAFYSTEGSWGDTTDTTFATRVPTLGEIDVTGLTQTKQDIRRTAQYQNEVGRHIRGVKGGSFTIRTPLSGHDGVTTGALTATTAHNLLSNALGGSDVANVGTTVNDASPTVTGFTVAGGTQATGSIIRVGELGDGAAAGQAAVVASGGGGTLVFLNALATAPANSDNVYVMQMAFPNETPGTAETITSTQWQFLSANKRYNCWGCFPTGVRLTGLAGGQLPSLEITYGVSYWELESSATFPTATSTQLHAPAPAAAGEFFINAVGTTTSNTLAIREFSMDIDYQVQPTMSPQTVQEFQAITGAVRLRCQATFTITVDAGAAGTETFSDEWNSDTATNRHMLYLMSSADGRSVGIYAPNCHMIGQRPVQRNLRGINRMQMTYLCDTGATTTSELTLSSFRIGLG